MLVQAELNARAVAVAPNPEKDETPTGAQSLWPDQAQLHDEFMSSARHGAVVAVEAGTGTGKSRIIGTCALSLLQLRKRGHKFPTQTNGSSNLPAFIKDRVAAWHDTEARLQEPRKKHSRPIVIAAPTIATMMHLVREFLRLGDNKATHSLLIGRQQFVSASAVAELLSEHPCPPVQEWLDKGMPPGQSTATRGIPASGLMEDLRAVCGDLDFPTKDAHLSAHHAEDEDCAEYRRLQTAAETSDIIFTTHAMLAMRTIALSRGNTPPIPQPYALLIDEAHALEEGFASVNGASLAMSRLGATLKREAWPGMGLKGKVDACRDSWTQAYMAMQALPDEVNLPLAPGNDRTTRSWALVRARLQTLRDQLADLGTSAMKSAKASQNAHLSFIMSSKHAIDLVLDDYTGRIEFSPTRRYPLIQMGVKSVSASLLYTWESTEVAGLFSGTLFAPSASLDSAANALAMELAVPRQRLQTTSRIHPSWLYTSPTLHLPKPGHAPTPPKGESFNEDGIKEWAEQIATHLKSIGDTAAGGTLALCTGYERAQIIANALRAQLNDPSRLIEQRTGTGVDGMARVFRQKSQEGLKPIAIATGGAWTGLDLSNGDVPPREDFLLTDVVITALPFNTQRSYLHAEKVQRIGMQVEINYTLRKFIQGIGRLVRRPGLQQRRLWILDSRLESVRTATYSSKFLAALSRYIKKSYF
ncbi:CRISPR type AFERR-associated DEAD/DEAH-box helicase Csf4 [Paracidovorax wautersii]|uniref:CRISPR type AFERR-associated DEAD/DEAH-box helicase Csf4 n=2 Tax=Paracidovorax wautersii TaxID=1177982 RepID=A0A1I2HWJ2_9BURK|nr:CRISPR type AFERR-associated DEAD/DEAH-box helicase Csf4 [Paracidovorax wautersii]